MSAAVIAAQPFTALTRAQFSATFYGYFYDFIAQTGAAVCIVIFLPHVFWLVTAMVSECEAGIRDVLLIAGVPRVAWLGSFLCVALLLFVPCWLLMAGLLKFMVFASTDFAAVFLLLLLTGLCLMTLSVLLAQAFRRAWVAGLASIAIVFVLGVVGVGASQSGSAAAQAVAAALLTPAGLAIGLSALARAEEAAAPIPSGGWLSAPPSSGLPFGALLAVMAGNALANAGVAWWLARAAGLGALPGSHTEGHEEDAAAAAVDEVAAASAIPGILFSPARAQGAPVLAQVRGLRKRFGAPGAPFSVDGASFDLRAGETLCLLGRIGCGKTTTIGCLTGLLAPTSGGAAFFLDGSVGGGGVSDGGGGGTPLRPLHLRRDMARIRQHVGMCPQHDVLWPQLTVRETLAVFAAVKGVPPSARAAEVSAWIGRIGLAEKADAVVATLSGGQKRRVSLATAYVGGSRLVFLDEPTSGIDPQSRRLVWEIVQANSAGRAVVLTTHHLDEGEVLAQRVALLSAGRMLALGTPAALKQQVGLGFHVACSCVADVTAGAAGSQLDGTAEAVQRCAAEVVPLVSVYSARGSEVTLDVAQADSGRLPALLRHLRANAAALRLASIGVTSASLQDLFVRVIDAAEATCTAGVDAAEKTDRSDDLCTVRVGAAHEPAVAAVDEQPSARKTPPPPGCWRRMGVLLRKRALLAARQPMIAALPLGIAVLLAVIMGAAFRSLSFQGCPASLLVSQPAAPVTSSVAGEPLFGGLGFVDALPAAVPVAMPTGILIPAQQATAVAGVAALSANATSLFGGLLPYTRPNAGGSGSPVWPDVTAAFLVGGPPFTDAAAINAATNALWRAASGAAASSAPAVVTSYQQFPVISSPGNSADATPFIALTFAMVVLWALIPPLASTVAVAQERLGGMKAQQRVTGVPPALYWCAHLCWDALVLLPCCMVVAAALALGVPAWRPDYGLTLLLLFLVGVATTLLGYLVSFVAPSVTAAIALTASYAILMAAGIFAAIVTQLGGSASPAQLSQGVVIQAATYAGMAVDPLVSLLWSAMVGSNALLMACGGNGVARADMWSYSQLGRPLVLLACQSLVLLAAVFAAESWPAWRMRAQLQSRRQAEKTAPALGSLLPGARGDCSSICAPDRDVAAEAAAVDATAAGGDAAVASAAVLAVRVRREYAGGLVGVSDVCLRLPRGEALGLLGVNGAGKSTLVRTLVGSDVPTAGDAVIAGHSLLADVGGVQRSVGYAPQFDVLFPSLSAVEHLRLYGGLKGLTGAALEREVDWLVAALDLGGAARYKPAATLSGGNKRKLSVAIAMLGCPPVLILDEISTGMDAMSKVVLWRALARLRERGQTLLLVTHAMDEAEAVAQRIAVMAAGRVVGLGTVQHLKSRFGAALQVDAELVLGEATPGGAEAAAAAFEAHLSAAFPGASILQRHGASLRASIPISPANAGVGAAAASGLHLQDISADGEGGAEDPFVRAFELLAAARSRREVLAFTVSQTSLEQIFLQLADAAGERPRPTTAQDAFSGRGTASYWGVATESFSASSLLWLLVVSPSLSWFLMMLVATLYLCAVALAVLPPLARPFAAATLATLRWSMRVERAAQARFCLFRNAGEKAEAFQPEARGCVRVFGTSMARLFTDPPTRRALLYVLLAKPLWLVLLGLLVAVLAIMSGCCSVFLLWPAGCILARRHVVWQRRWLEELASFD